MMGTGEASGENRARDAAEAAIANPLLDETSMKGAKGLLISITGGKDLTLFEVDEAATRIREEVDPDANIILGATFEEALEGIIRVSVVATGIDNSTRAAATPPSEQINADIAQRLRAQLPIAAAPQPKTAPAMSAPRMPQAPPRATPQPVQQPIVFDPGPLNYGPGDLDELVPTEAEAPAQEPFIPPAPEAPSRIPRVEDFPPVAQRQIEARQAPARSEHHEDRGPMSLLRRLASVGLGRKEEAPTQRTEAPPLQRPIARPQQPQRATQPQSRAAQPARPQPKQEQPLYRPQQGDLDQHGRAIPNQSRSQDDELEIPAFLRRQAN
jgi:cell division protein FtsZ